MIRSPIIVPKTAKIAVHHRSNLGMDTYELNELYSPDTALWKSKVLDLGSPKYPPQVATAPTRYWFDRSRYNNHGTIVGATWTRLSGGLCYLSFDGVDDIVTIADATSIQNIFDSGGTFMAWINPKTSGEGSAGVISNKVRWFALNTDWLGQVMKIRFDYAFDGTTGRWDTTARVLNINKFQFFAITYNNSAVGNDPTIYLGAGGVLTAYTVGSGLTETTTPVGTRVSDAASNLTIGNNAATTLTFNGGISQTGATKGVIYTAAQLQGIYQQTRHLLGV